MKIEIVDYVKIIKGATVLDHINLMLEEKELYGLRGANGSGKSMLMRAICGLIKPTSGHIAIDGKVVGKDISFPPSIGILIESPSFIDEYTGFDNLKIIARIKGLIGDDDIRNTLTEIGLDPKDRRPYKKYSLGMRQRLGIACAIMEHPLILLLDEPLNGLDPEGSDLALSAIRRRHDEGAFVMMACHDAAGLNTFASCILQMERGRIVGQ